MKPTIAMILALVALNGWASLDEVKLVDGKLLVIDWISTGGAMCHNFDTCPPSVTRLSRTTYVARDGKIVVEKVEDGTRIYERQPDKKIETWKVRK